MNVAAGDIILERDPWVWAFQWSKYSTICAGCFFPLEIVSHSPLSCPGCRTHRYCSEQCQNADWKVEHSFECALMKQLTDYRQQVVCHPELEKLSQDRPAMHGPHQIDNTVFAVGVLLTLKVHNKIQKSIMDSIPALDGKRSAKEIIQSFDADRSTSEAQKIIKFTKSVTFKNFLLAIYAKDADRPTEEECADILIRVSQNVHPVWDHNREGTGPQQYGAGVFLAMKKSQSLTVCLDYNTMAIFPGKMLRLVAIDDIPNYRGWKDIRLFEPSSHDMMHPVKQRREYFQQKYGRECGCRKCTDQFDAEINPLKCVSQGCPERIPSDERALLPCAQCGALNEPRLQALRRFMEKHETDFKRDTAMQLGTQPSQGGLKHQKMAIIEELNKLDILQPGAHLRMVCGWIVTDVYEEQKRFEEAWTLYQDCMLCTRQIFPKYHVVRAQFLAFAGQFAITWAERMANDPPKKSVTTTALIRELVEWGSGYLKESANIYFKLFGRACLFALGGEMRICEAQEILRTVEHDNE
ncbi:SET and MYND domain-containing protein DDB_G0292140-like [Paramacrobiotus metropolitanus]|uniref:SET and MYND domain-containing protein DDB_G0292140-like n=1 Tax=Paramacrobiotus metropolitanus TaxID=2943436 RepID=UPI002445E5B3|nr:SET and MYND domain-containing protein DDB_G0292140-like [Paramacrobiotus metropolitanus]